MDKTRRVAALALGGNLGDSTEAFIYALERLDGAPETAVVAVSSVYRTPPWGVVDQPDFLNMAALVETTLDPHGLLALCLKIENERGRERMRRWGPRTLDIDVIDYDGLALDANDLQLPHPRAHERAFVLAPLAQIAPDLMLAGRCARDLAAADADAGLTPSDVETSRLRNAFNLRNRRVP